MSPEDLDAWDVTPQVCLARALDHVADTTRYSTTTRAPPRAPTSQLAPLQCAAELVSHLEMPADTPAPHAFVNDTLVNLYPPESRNNVASLRLIRAATRVVDTCPIKQLRDVVGALQEGLSVWLADYSWLVPRRNTRSTWVVNPCFLPLRWSDVARPGCFRLFLCTRQLWCACSCSPHRPTFSKFWARNIVSPAARTNYSRVPRLLGLDLYRRPCSEGWMAHARNNLP